VKLSVLLNQPAALLPCSDLDIQGLALDSRAVRTGDCFFAYPGHQIDGRDFMKEAASLAAAIVYDPEALTPAQEAWLGSSPVPTIPFKHLAKEISHLAARFHGKPSQDQHVIAVTGTNGKSSIVHGLNQLYGMLNEPIAMIGTIGVGVLTQLKKAQLTTPDPVKLQATLKELRDQGIENIAIEASSHALDQDRLSAVDIDVAIFTQISRDHLDYHKTLSDYVKAKSRLFQFKSVKHVVINLDCPWFYGVIDSIPHDKVIIGYTLQDKDHPRLAALLKGSDVHASLLGQEFTLQYMDKTYPVSTRLLGEFNVSNIMAMIAAMMADGFNPSEITALIPALQTVPGRLDILRVENQPLAVIDYAHTPDALEKVLLALKPLCRGKLICVFGCGGDRDKGKRPQMGAIAARLCDQVILTDDNPRSEDPTAIVNDILSGIDARESIEVIHDRGRAIDTAIERSNPQDCILIAGKGHETTQVIRNTTLEFCDKTYTEHSLQARSAR
jgi:UDP-N-acetylmuramoyl-L-alanyl-D-glutamate--2,6-diaminopimelate ligase